MDSYNNTDKNLTKPPGSKKLPISIFVISLPLLYVSLLDVPLSSLFKDTAFLFLISNSIIIVVAAESGVFASSSSPTSSTNDALYDDYVRHVPKARSTYSNSISQTSNMGGEEEEIPKHIVRESSNAREEESSKEIRLDSEPEPEPAEQKQEQVSEPEPELELEITEVAPERPKYERRWSELPLTKTEISSKDLLPRANTTTEKRSCAMEESDYVRMSDEELNKRVEDFIRRFNREIRLQERMSSAVF